MGKRWRPCLMAFVLVGSACVSVGRAEWAEEAVAWHDDMIETQLAHGGWGVARVFSADVVWDDAAVYGESTDIAEIGRAAYERATTLLGPESLAFERDTFFVSTTGLINFLIYDWAPLGNDRRPDTKAPANGIGVFGWEGPAGADSLVNAMAIEDWDDRHPESPHTDEAEAVATSWAEVWSGATGMIEDLYTIDAVVEDTIAGTEITGRSTIAEAAATAGAWEISTVGHDLTRGVYPFVRTAGTATVLQEVVLVASGQDESGCAGELAVLLALDDGLVARETRYWPIDRARRCLPAGDLPAGWWNDEPLYPPSGDVTARDGGGPPTEDLEVATEPLRVGDTIITIYNGRPVLNELLAWGLGRFETAGLSPPTIAAVTFTRYSQRCDDARGWYRESSDGAQLVFCFDEGAACRDDDCSTFTPASRSLVLHELAHAWMDTTLDDITRARFSDHVDLSAWNDHDVDWIERAVEHAADTIAWGLMDRELAMYRLGMSPPSPDHLDTGFRILTGAAPLPRADRSPTLQQPL